jgi:hypothetical protein
LEEGENHIWGNVEKRFKGCTPPSPYTEFLILIMTLVQLKQVGDTVGDVVVPNLPRHADLLPKGMYAEYATG